MGDCREKILDLATGESKGQIVIPANAREAMGLKGDDKLLVLIKIREQLYL